MKTNVLMKRSFYNAEISQRSKDKFLNATELLRFYNLTATREKAVAEFWRNKNTKEYMKALVEDLNQNTENMLYLEKDLYTTTRGINGGTYMHPYLFIKFATWTSPAFEVKIIKWIYDNLIEERNQAGTHYLEMCKVISERYENHFGKKADPLVFIKEARFLNSLVFGDKGSNKRNIATEKELDVLNQLQLANIHLIKSKISISDRKKRLTEMAELIKL